MSSFTALGGNNKSVPINCGSLNINYTVSCVLTSLIAAGPCQEFGGAASCSENTASVDGWPTTQWSHSRMCVHSVESCGHHTLDSKSVLFLIKVKGA